MEVNREGGDVECGYLRRNGRIWKDSDMVD